MNNDVIKVVTQDNKYKPTVEIKINLDRRG
jgi:hypothetical protein